MCCIPACPNPCATASCSTSRWNRSIWSVTSRCGATASLRTARGIPRFTTARSSGRLATEFTYNYKAGGPTALKCDGRFAVAEITVNGVPAGTMLFSRTLELADFLTEGENKIGITIINSMRNAMGPHHRHDPEPYGLGPNTFSFEKEWNGRECGGYLPRYAFVRFGIKK